MGSIFTTTPNDMDQTSIFGTKQKSPVFLQFVPGVVTEVANSIESLSCNGVDGNVNSIKALPHIGKLDMKKGSTLSEKYRYYPLLRGMVDVPTEGDPVLLCSFGGVNYYLGPLNTENRPNKSKDMFANDQLFDDGRALPRKQTLGSRAFIPQRRVRLQKTQNKKLDFPNNTLESVEAINSVSPDMMFEGRHGNSIRIGSRDVNPYIFLSNGRYKHERTENIFAGSLITLIKKGSLRDHFGVYSVAKTEKPVTEEATDRIAEELPGFILASDKQVKEDGDNKNKHLMSSIIKSVNELDNVENQIYNYGNNDFENQVFITSDRLTFNSRREDIYMSSHQDIHIGTRRHLTISTKEKVIIETEGFNIGNPNKTENKDKMEPIVLGNQLQEILREMLNLLSTASIYMFCPTPLTDLKGQPIGPKFGELLGKLDSIISNKHFIEPKNK